MTSPLVIHGTATAGHRVVVTIEFQGKGLASPTGVIGPVRTAVTSGGTWEVRVALSAGLPATGRMTITAVAVAPSGARSDPARVVLTWTPQRVFERP